MKIHFAPMQGHTDHIYRRCHALIYGPADAYYTPFIRIENGVPRRQDMARLDDTAYGLNLIPQVIFNSAQEFTVLTNAIKEKGFERIDLNMGCPYPMQTRKGRGAALIGRPEVLEHIADLINADHSCAYSLKMRLGMANADEWVQIIPILNHMRLSHITLHPCTAKQMYNGALAPEQFSMFADASANPVIWNGGITDISGIEKAAKLKPAPAAVMIGRGLLGRPSLCKEWKQGKEWDKDDRLGALIRFHDAVFSLYSETLCGDAQILQKIKPFWEYLEPEIGHKAFKAISKAGSLANYRNAVASI